MTNNTIYALSTVFGKSGVAVIRISGDKVLEVVSGITNIKTETIKPRFAYFTNIINPKTKEVLDKSLVVYFKAPYSFTGEDILEIQCHGSKAVLNSVLNVLSLVDGVRLAEPGEFSKRAFYNNKMDLTEAEGLADLIDAETSEQQKYALRQLSGGLKNLYTSWRQDLVRILSYLEAFIDFPEEDIPSDLSNDILNTVFKVKNDITLHLKGNNVNERLRSGFRIVITGAPNAGKSSLINTLVKRNAVIVSDIEGTTRDTLSESYIYKDVKFNFIDTAGLRQTDDVVESIGIERSLQAVKKADIVLLVYDGSEIPAEYIDIKTNSKTICVFNKADVMQNPDKGVLSVSAKTGFNVEELKEAIYSKIKMDNVSSTDVVITNSRHIDCLQRANNSLRLALQNSQITLDCIALEIKEGWQALGEITGTTASEDVVSRIFEKFCVGK